jgi:hypothetical protein
VDHIYQRLFIYKFVKFSGRKEMDDHIIANRRKRSRSVGSIDSDTPDEYHVDLNDLEATNDDKSWSKGELAKIAKISTQMLNEEQEENIKKSFRELFPTKPEEEIKKLCDTMKTNIIKELIKQEKAKVHAAKKEKNLNKILSLEAIQQHNALSSSSSLSTPLVDPLLVTEDVIDLSPVDDLQSPLKNKSPFQGLNNITAPGRHKFHPHATNTTTTAVPSITTTVIPLHVQVEKEKESGKDEKSQV